MITVYWSRNDKWRVPPRDTNRHSPREREDLSLSLVVFSGKSMPYYGRLDK